MKYFILFFLLVFSLIISTCTKDAEVSPKEYPYVITGVPEVSSEGAIVSANLISSGNEKIVRYGFVWSENENPTVDDCSILFSGNIGRGKYKASINTGLKEGLKYSVRAYVQTDTIETYGNPVTFISQGSLPPKITSFTPSGGFAGDKVIINGRNFISNCDYVSVKFGDITASIDSISDNRIIVTSPLIPENKKIRISVTIAGMTDSTENYYEVFYAWTRKADGPQDSKNAITSFVINGKGYIVDYSNGQYVWDYNPATDEWTRKGDMFPTLCSDISSFVYGNEAYVISCQSPTYYKYNPRADTWSPIMQYPGKRGYTVSFMINNNLYIGTGNKNSAGINEFLKYDPETNQWSKIASFPGSSRDYPTGFSLNGKGYVCLGRNANSYYKDVWAYDPVTDRWSQKNDFPGSARELAVSFVLKSKIYVGLGVGENGSGYHDIWEYHQESDTWIRKDSYPGNGISRNVILNFSDRVFLGGGISSGKIYNDLWEFDPNTE